MLNRIILAALLLAGCSPSTSGTGADAASPIGAGGTRSQVKSRPAKPAAPWPPPALSPDLKRFVTSGIPIKIEAEFKGRETTRSAGCTLAGSVDGVELPLFASETAGKAFAVLEWGDFARVNLPDELDGRVEAQLGWPLASRVYVRQGSLPFSLGRAVELQAKVAWLGPGGRVSAARSGQANTVKVTRRLAAPPVADFRPPAFDASLACSDLELPRHEVLFREDPSLPGAGLPRGEFGELKQPTSISERAGAPSTVQIGGPGWPVFVHKSRAGLSLVSDRSVASWGEHGFAFFGWVPASTVRRGGAPVTLETTRVGVKPSHVACNEAELRVESAQASAVVAQLSDGLPVLVFEHQGDFASVLVPGLRAASERAGLWLHRSSLCPLPG